MEGSSSKSHPGIFFGAMNPFRYKPNGFAQILNARTSKPFALHGQEDKGFSYIPYTHSLQTMEQSQRNQIFGLQELGVLNRNFAIEPPRISAENRNHNADQEEKKDMIKGSWTSEEDRMLVQLVARFGAKKWAQIATQLRGRVGKQCRERWHNHLRPDIKKDIWTLEEDMLLIQEHKKVGNKWAEIAKSLPGRSENTIKNHWNATKRRRDSSKRKSAGSNFRSSMLHEYIKSTMTSASSQVDEGKERQTPRQLESSSLGSTSGQWEGAQVYDHVNAERKLELGNLIGYDVQKEMDAFKMLSR